MFCMWKCFVCENIHAAARRAYFHTHVCCMNTSGKPNCDMRRVYGNRSMRVKWDICVWNIHVYAKGDWHMWKQTHTSRKEPHPHTLFSHTYPLWVEMRHTYICQMRHTYMCGTRDMYVKKDYVHTISTHMSVVSGGRSSAAQSVHVYETLKTYCFRTISTHMSGVGGGRSSAAQSVHVKWDVCVGKETYVCENKHEDVKGHIAMCK